MRMAETEDLGIVTALRAAFLADLRSMIAAEFAPTFVEQMRSFVETSFRQGRLRSWLAVDQDQPAGIVSMLLHDMRPLPEDARTLEGYLVNMYVKPEHRRQGIGKALLDECLADALSSGLRRLNLHATDAARPLCMTSQASPQTAVGWNCVSSVAAASASSLNWWSRRRFVCGPRGG